MDWLQELPLSPAAAAERQKLTPEEFQSVQTALEHLALVSEIPVIELAEALIGALVSMSDKNDIDPFMMLLERIIQENE